MSRQFPPRSRHEEGKVSPGCIIAIVVGLVVAIGGVIVALVVFGAGAYFVANQSGSTPVSVSNAPGGTSPTSSGGSTSGAEKAAPTSAQQAAVAGGSQITWSQQNLSWTLPSGWKKLNEDKQTLNYGAPGNGAFLIVSISPMSPDFPVEQSLEAFKQQALQRMTNGEVTQARMVELDGVKGVEFYEATPEQASSPQRLQWLGYRTYLGQTQMINIILSSAGKDASKYDDALHGILYSTKIPH